MSDPQFEFVQCMQDEVTETKSAKNDPMSSKSCVLYQAAYQKFIKWCDERNIDSYSENELLEYFTELSTTMKMKSSTMWSQYSMVKSLLIINKGIDISKYTKLREYLKAQNEGYTPKKSRSFTKEEILKFLSKAPDYKYLGLKVVLIIGIAGGCRRDEMVRMTIDDIEDLGSLLYIKVPDTSTNKIRTFKVTGENSLKLYRKYVSLRPADMTHQRLFVKYQNGKCHRLVMGVNKIGNVPKEVASYLKLPHWDEYTAHCFKGTLSTLIVDGRICY